MISDSVVWDFGSSVLDALHPQGDGRDPSYGEPGSQKAQQLQPKIVSPQVPTCFHISHHYSSLHTAGHEHIEQLCMLLHG